MYDAAEAGILYAIDEIARFQDDYKGVVVSRVVKGRVALFRVVGGAHGHNRPGHADSLEQQADPFGRFGAHLFDSVPLQDGELPVCRSAVVVQVDSGEGVSCSRQVVPGVVPPSSYIVRADGMAGVLLHPSPNPRHVDLRVSGSHEDRMDVVSLSRGSLDKPGS